MPSTIVRRADEDTIFGVSKAMLAALPSNVRFEVLSVLEQADDARRSGDAKAQAAVAQKVRKALGSLGEHNGERIVEKFFLESLRPQQGDHDIVRTFAKRAGATS